VKQLHQEMRFCEKCKKTQLFQGNKAKINWVMHIALMFVAGLGFITLAFAILGRTFGGRIGGKRGLYCQGCGTEV